jgi:hypothetical protein
MLVSALKKPNLIDPVPLKAGRGFHKIVTRFYFKYLRIMANIESKTIIKKMLLTTAEVVA